MKSVIRILSIFFLIGGLLICVAAGEVKESAQPNKVTFGIMTNGQYKETDHGYIGGNHEVSDDMDYLNGIGVMIIILGGCGIIGSFIIKPKEDYNGL